MTLGALWLLACTPRGTPEAVTVTVDANIATVLHVTWETEEPELGRVEFGTDDGYGTRTTLEAEPSTQHTATLLGLRGDTLVHLRTLGDDRVGADHTATTGSFLSSAS